MLRTSAIIFLLFQFFHIVTARETARLSYDHILQEAMKPCYETHTGCSLRDVHNCWPKDECLECRKNHAECFKYMKIQQDAADLAYQNIPTITKDDKLLVDPYKLIINEQHCLKHFADYGPDCLKQENIDYCLDMCSPGREAFHMIISEKTEHLGYLVEQYVDKKGAYTKWYCLHGRLITIKKTATIDKSFPLWGDFDQEKLKAKHVWQASMFGKKEPRSTSLRSERFPLILPTKGIIMEGTTSEVHLPSLGD